MRVLFALASVAVGAAAAFNWQILSRCERIALLKLRCTPHGVEVSDTLVVVLVLTCPPSLNSIFGKSSTAATGRNHGALDSIVDKLAQRISAAQPHSPPPVVLIPASVSISASPMWASVLPLGLIAASSFAISRYFGSGAESMSAVAQVR